MRKQTKLVAVLSAAALLAIGASMTSFAATGWTEEDGTWVYYDKDGYKVTDSWKKSGDYWYYLDEDGYMATERLIENSDEYDNIFYVDETGRMVANRWVELENENYYDNGDDEDSETVWYYFQNSGKAYKTSGETSFKTINGKKYAFNEDGHMLWGWVDTNSGRVAGGDAYLTATYYCGDASDGARVSNDWRYLYVEQAGPDSEDDNYWFYFGSNGKKVAANDSKTINGKKYAFDEFGVMISEWNRATEATAADLVGYYSDSNNGARKKGWFQAVPSEHINNGAFNDDEAKWFYANNDGKLVVEQIKTINGKKYAFNEDGEMLSGLWVLEVDADNVIVDSEKIDKQSEVEDLTVTVWDKASVYYFGSGEDGSMKTGNQSVEVDGENYQFTFGKNGEKKGQGINGVDGNVLYVYGKRIKADADYRYQAVKADGTVVKPTSDDVNKVLTADYLVNTSGSVMKGTGTYTDSEGRQYKVAKTEDAEGNVRYNVTYLGFKD